MTRLFIAFILILTTHSLLAQSNFDLMPKGAVLSPHTAELGKYDHYPVSYFTGLPQISIPLYEVQQGDISVPITLNYHASGIKVESQATWVGSGWSLEAGGMISRQLMGRADEEAGYLSTQIRSAASLDLNNATDLHYVRMINQGVFDTQPDVFNYSLPGISGQFIFNKDDLYKPLLIPYAPVLIDRYYVSGSAYMRFTVKDTKGLIYRLGEVREMTEISNGPYCQSGWNLTEIISPSLIDTVKFSYVQNSGLKGLSQSESLTYEDYVVNYQARSTYQSSPVSGYRANSISEDYGTETFVSEIKFKSGKVVFTQTNVRQDGLNPNQKSLDAISVYSYDEQSKTYIRSKNIAFYYSYFINNDYITKRLRLDSIHIQDKNLTKIQRYKFDYNQTPLPNRISRNIDYWGYFNYKSNTSLIPRMQIDFGGSPLMIGSNIVDGREPNPTYSQACILNRIDYPTGGYTTFEYEGNAYLDVGQPKFAGGLRIKSMSLFASSTSVPIKKILKYGSNEDGYGRQNFILNHAFFQTENSTRLIAYFQIVQGQKHVIGEKRTRTYFSRPSLQIEPFDGSPVVYSTVTEYIGDANGINGKTVYTYSDPSADVLTMTAACGKPFIKSYHFDRGNLLSKNMFKMEGGIYKLVNSQYYQYENFEQSLHNVGLIVYKRVKTDDYDSNITDVSLSHDDPASTDLHDSQSYLYADYVIRSGKKSRLLSTTNQIIYDQSDPSKGVSNGTGYIYDAVHELPIVITKSSDRGQSEAQQLTYPHDFPSTAPYTSMIAKNMLNYPVTETTSIGVSPIMKKETVYFDWGNNLIAPKEIKSQNLTNQSYQLETEVIYEAYNTKGKLTQAKGKDGVSVSLIWGYGNQYLTAQVKNATVSNVAYTSFEGGINDGGFTFGGAFPNTDYKTGKKSYKIGGSSTSITRPGLTSSNSYKITFWAKSGTPSVANVISSNDDASAGSDGWRYFEKTISGTLSLTITVPAGTAIDELRLYPVGAEMTTYTYDPLVGATTIIDPNNKMTFYRYDAANRLQAILDFQNKILKTYQYNYKN